MMKLGSWSGEGARRGPLQCSMKAMVEKLYDLSSRI